MSIKQLWVKLENYLSRQNKEVLSNLNPAISEDMLNQLRARFKSELPKPFIESLKIHDGQPPAYKHDALFTNWHFLQSSEIIEKHEFEMKEMDYRDPGAEDEYIFDKGVRKKMFDSEWVPITATVSTHSYFFIDMNPDTGGHKGQIVFCDTERNKFGIVSKSFEEWFRLCVDARCNNEDYKLWMAQESISQKPPSVGKIWPPGTW